MKLLIKSVLVLFLFISFSNSEEANNTTSKQFEDWQLICKEVEKKERCEVSQLITIEENKLQFKIMYQILKDEKTKKKFDAFTIITPLGVNLTEKAAILFPDTEEQINLSFVKCEVFGCILTLNNFDQNSKEVFDFLKKKLLSSEQFTLGFGVFNEKPVLISSSLKGFKNSVKQLREKAKKI